MTDEEIRAKALSTLGRFIQSVQRTLNRAQLEECLDQAFRGYGAPDSFSAEIADRLICDWKLQDTVRESANEQQKEDRRIREDLERRLRSVSEYLQNAAMTTRYAEAQALLKEES